MQVVHSDFYGEGGTNHHFRGYGGLAPHCPPSPKGFSPLGTFGAPVPLRGAEYFRGRGLPPGPCPLGYTLFRGILIIPKNILGPNTHDLTIHKQPKMGSRQDFTQEIQTLLNEHDLEQRLQRIRHAKSGCQKQMDETSTGIQTRKTVLSE